MNTRFLIGLVSSILVGLPASASSFAGIPIEEEFVASQWIYVDTSFDMITAFLFSSDGSLDYSSPTLGYYGTFNIDESLPGSFSGSIHGNLNGNYLGELWEFIYAGDVTTEGSSDSKTLNTSFTSSGTWKNGPFKGKTFKDMGTIVEKSDNTADLVITISTDGVDANGNPIKDITGTYNDLKKTKKDGKLNVGGKVTIEVPVVDKDGKPVLDKDKKPKVDKYVETLSIEIDQATKKGNSKLVSKYIRDIVILENTGEFSYDEGTKTGSTSFDLTLKVQPVPAPLPLLGLAAVFAYKKRLKDLSRSVQQRRKLSSKAIRL
jgi:hypothetical protein